MADLGANSAIRKGNVRGRRIIVTHCDVSQTAAGISLQPSFLKGRYVIKMDFFNVKPLGKRELFQFKCTRCGDCCRRIKESVMLESLDAYRLAKFLRKTDPSIQMMEDMLIKYAYPIPLTDTGFPIYVLKTLGDDDTGIVKKSAHPSFW